MSHEGKRQGIFGDWADDPSDTPKKSRKARKPRRSKTADPAQPQPSTTPDDDSTDTTSQPPAFELPESATDHGRSAWQDLLSYLDHEQLPYRENDSHTWISLDGYPGDAASYRIIAEVDESARLFQVFGDAPTFIPEGSRPAVAETITRANDRLRNGKFELDLDNGRLRFSVCQVLSGAGLDHDVIERLLYSPVTMLDRYLPAVLSVIYGNEVPKDAIRCVEAAPLGGDTEGGERATGD